MADDKKIMLISPMLHQGGFERVCILTARLLSRTHKVVIVVFSMEDIAFDVSGLEIINLGLGVQKGTLGKLINVFRRGAGLSRIQKKLGIDVSYSFGMTANIANALSTGAGKKISSCHSFEEIKNRLYMKLISHFTDQVLCCSEKMADLVRSNYGVRNVRALWNPCDRERLLEQSTEQADTDILFFRTGDRVLVSMGREDDVKGFWHLIRIFRRVNEEEEDTRLAIIGDGEFKEYKDLVKRLGMEEKVLFTGLKKNPFPYLRESHIYVLTSLSEGLPNALVEALALSLPVVSANCMSGPAEILHGDFRVAEARKEVFKADYGILSPVLSGHKDFSVNWEEGSACGRIRLEESEEKFAGAVLALLRDKELYNMYRDRAMTRAGDFSTAGYMEGLVSCMREI